MNFAELIKWKYHREKRLCTTIERISGEDVDELLDALSDLDKYSYIRVWTGVHGEPGGLVSVGEPDFTLEDRAFAQVGSGNPQHPDITIHSMAEATQSAPPEMLQQLSRNDTAVVLAWCYSDGYISTN